MEWLCGTTGMVSTALAICLSSTLGYLDLARCPTICIRVFTGRKCNIVTLEGGFRRSLLRTILYSNYFYSNANFQFARMSDIAEVSYLSSVIGRPTGGYIYAANQFRRYAATMRTESTIGGVVDGRAIPIYYEIGRHHDKAKDLLRRAEQDTMLIEASYPTSNVLSEEFLGLAKKYSNFSASFRVSNLSGIAERLGKTLGALSLYPDLSSDAIRGGANLRINVLGTYDAPVNSLVNTVFIPRLVDSPLTGSVFTVLANAVAGEGAAIATDVLEIGAGDRQPILTRVEDGMARSVVEALRIVGSNMQACSQGPLFALAVTRGIHQAVSVVGHTDEGGITRDLLRSSGFSTPFGGIHCSLPEYGGLPALSTDGMRDVAAYVDSIAMCTAALVAHCDPGMVYNGYWFPTFYNGTTDNDATLRPGRHQEGTQHMARRNTSQYVSNISPFAELYTTGLGKLFGAEGHNSTAVTFMTTTATLMPRDSRHFLYATVSPYFWIEPTSLLPHDFLGSRAEQEGSGSFATPCQPRSKPAWESIQMAGTGDVSYSAYHALVRNPRSAWFFAHWLNNSQNGLGCISVRQLDSSCIIQPGASEIEEEVRDRVDAALPWTEFLWTRGQSPLCAPGELLNLSGTVGFLVNHTTIDRDGIPTDEHVPTYTEFQDTMVTVHVGRPNGIQQGPSNHRENGVRRARTQAAKQLAASTARAKKFGRSDVAEMPTMHTAPVLGSKSIRKEDDGPGHNTSPSKSYTAGGSDLDPDRQHTGSSVPAVAHYGSQNFPQIVRPGMNVGGGAAPIPATKDSDSKDDVTTTGQAYANPAQGDERPAQ